MKNLNSNFTISLMLIKSPDAGGKHFTAKDAKDAKDVYKSPPKPSAAV